MVLNILFVSAARNATQPMISCPDVLIEGCLSLCEPFCLGLDLVLAGLGLCLVLTFSGLLSFVHAVTSHAIECAKTFCLPLVRQLGCW
jgi:hypothetical protein